MELNIDYERNIDKLVLGYLKDECKNAYKLFYKSKFTHKRNNLGKHFSTRIAGKTLRDILKEYGHICDIIQGKIEETNYYDDDNADEYSPLKQLNYLLNFVPGESRSTTPFSRACTRSSTPSESGQEVCSSDMEATPEHTLPGNKECMSENSYFQKNAKEKASNANLSNTAVDNISPEKRTELLAHKVMLGKKELHNKLASTINAVLNISSENCKQIEQQNLEKHNKELDQTIKTVIRKTEEDPIFENLIQEIIDESPPYDTLYNEHSSTTYNYHMPDLNKPRYQDSFPSTINTSSTNTVQMSRQHIPKPNSSDVVMFDGNLDNYISTTSCSVPTQTPMQNSVGLINGNILIPSPMVQAPHCFIVNNTPQILLNSNKLSAEDIMAMPTVILKDDNNKGSDGIKGPIKKVERAKPKSLHPKPKSIHPKPVIKIPVNTGECITLYGQEDQLKSETVGLKRIIPPRLRPEKSKSISTKNDDSNVSNKSESKQNVGQKEEEQKIPQARTPSSSSNVTKKQTPKSGSHVRSLDFSTPPKITSSTKKNYQSPQFIHKKQAAKTLFQNKTMKASIFVDTDESTHKKNGNSMISQWDKSIREAAVGFNTSPSKLVSSSKRKRSSTPKSKKKAKKVKTDEINTSDPDGKILEAALATPQKTVIENEVITNAEADAIDAGNTKIMSPSKVIGSKKNVLIMSNTNQEDSKEILLTTPDNPKDTVAHPVTNANRDISHILETPLKDLPKTPGLITPGHVCSILTPYTFSKTIEENFRNVDLNSINTPHFPCTPSFPPFTPGMPNSNYSNRPTDYSATSAESYYQPSDSEQNKSIEMALKAEEEKLETGTVVTILSNVVVRSSETNVEDKQVGLGDHLKNFNKNIIGKKNLSLLSRKSSTPSSSSDSDDDYEASNKTIISLEKGESVKSGYSLRTRSSNKQREEEESKIISESKASDESNDKLANHNTDKPTNSSKSKTSDSSSKTEKEAEHNSKENKKAPAKSKTKKRSSEEALEKENVKHATNKSNNKSRSERRKSVDSRRKSAEKVHKEKAVEKEASTTNEKQDKNKKVSNKSKSSAKISEKEKDNQADCNESKVLEVSLTKSKIVDESAITKQATEGDIKEIISSVHVKKTLTKEQLIESQREKVIREMEAKRKRTIACFKSESKQKSNKTYNRRPVTKYKVGHTKARSPRKNKRKSDSPMKAVVEKKDTSSFMPDLSTDEDDEIQTTKQNDRTDTPPPVEARNLIEGLKERGIHLVHNKNSKNEDIKDDPEDTKDDKLQKDVKGDTGKKLDGSAELHCEPIKEQAQPKLSEQAFNEDVALSFNGNEEQYDIKIYKQETEHIVHNNDSKLITKVYDLELLEKPKYCKIILDDSEHKVPIKATPFFELLDITSSINVLTPRKKRSSDRASKSEVDEKSNVIDDDLMNYAIIGSEREENLEESLKTSNVKKRKSRSDSSSLSSSEKKPKEVEPGTTLLKELDVDKFLNEIHGQGN